MGEVAAIGRLQTEHRKSHHLLDALGAPVLDGKGNTLKLSARIRSLAKRLGVSEERLDSAMEDDLSIQIKSARKGMAQKVAKAKAARKALNKGTEVAKQLDL